MKKDVYILAIESSCDETSMAIIKNGTDNIKTTILTQMDTHALYGGVVPEIASRMHSENITMVFEDVFKDTNLTMDDIDAVAVTYAPGLLGSLLVGIEFAKTIALVYKKPLIKVHHIAGHIYANNLVKKMQFPLLALVISGGHTELVLMEDDYKFKVLGKTLDDAIGEVYDKVARVLFNQFPGGPVIDQIFQDNRNKISTNIKLLNPKLEQELDFSFSGYKTQIMNLSKLDSINKIELAYTFQQQTIDFIISKVKLAIAKYQTKSIILSGGVSANSYLREQFLKLHSNALIPSLKYSTDNGAMIAIAAYIQKINNK